MQLSSCFRKSACGPNRFAIITRLSGRPLLLRTRVVAVLLIIHGLLLWWIDSRISPTMNEISHLPAGLRILEHGAFDLYSVNPPLVRLVAAIPVYLSVLAPTGLWSQTNRIYAQNFQPAANSVN